MQCKWKNNGNQMHNAENECAMPIRLHCNELRTLCLTTNALCRTAKIGALLLKCVLMVNIWLEKGVWYILSKRLTVLTLYNSYGVACNQPTSLDDLAFPKRHLSIPKLIWSPLRHSDRSALVQSHHTEAESFTSRSSAWGVCGCTYSNAWET